MTANNDEINFKHKFVFIVFFKFNFYNNFKDKFYKFICTDM